jgi:hypothetical protein
MSLKLFLLQKWEDKDWLTASPPLPCRLWDLPQTLGQSLLKPGQREGNEGSPCGQSSFHTLKVNTEEKCSLWATVSELLLTTRWRGFGVIDSGYKTYKGSLCSHLFCFPHILPATLFFFLFFYCYQNIFPYISLLSTAEHIFSHIYSHIHSLTHTLIYTYLHTYNTFRHTHTWTHTHIHLDTHSHTHIHTYIHTTLSDKHFHTHSHIHSQTHIQTDSQTFTHTYTLTTLTNSHSHTGHTFWLLVSPRYTFPPPFPPVMSNGVPKSQQVQAMCVSNPSKIPHQAMYCAAKWGWAFPRTRCMKVSPLHSLKHSHDGLGDISLQTCLEPLS